MPNSEHIDTVVIGGGQAGLAAGYWLARTGREFVILDAQARAGDSWRLRWDSLQLFSPARFNSLPGLPFPRPQGPVPTKDEMGAYLETYAARFKLPVQLGTWVTQVTHDGDRYALATATRTIKANHVIVATGAYRRPWRPSLASELDPAVAQLHSADYRNPSQLPDGPVLVVGAGNSGVEIALELAPRGRVWLAGRDTGSIPVDFGSARYRLGTRLFHILMQRLTVDTPPGRWLVRKAKEFSGGHPVVGVQPEALARAGVARVPRVTGVIGGRPVVEDGRVLDAATVMWCTGFVRDFAWIKLPVFGAGGEPVHHRGVVAASPGLYFVGLPFQSSLLSGLVAGAGPDARHVVRQLGVRAKAAGPAQAGRPERAGHSAGF